MPSASRLTKSQRRRRNKKAKHETARWFDDNIGPMPAEIASAFEGVAPNIEPSAVDQLTPEERAPRHIVDYTEEVPTFKDEALRNIRARTADIRQNMRDDQIASLKLRYRSIWGKRGAAETISISETQTGNPISIRTVQRYFKLSP